VATKIEIFNYKTIKHAVFEVDGYTLLLGKNFIGKSALITAIVSAFINRTGDGFIRHGEKFAEVRITYGKYFFAWHKEEGNSFYTLSDGETTRTLEKIGAMDLPREIVEAGFGPIVIGGKKNLLWYARQLEVLFLIDKPRQNSTTDLIASVTKIDAVYKAVELAKKDLKASKAELKVRGADIRDAKQDLSKFEPLEEYAIKESILTGIRDQNLAIQKEVAFLEKSTRDLEEHSTTLRKYHPAVKLTPVSTVPLGGDLKEIVKLDGLMRQYRDSQAEVESLSSVPKVPGYPTELLNNSEGLAREISNLDDLSHRLDSAQKVVVKCRDAGKIPSADKAYKAVASLAKEVASIAVLEDKLKKANEGLSRVKAAGSLKPVPVPHELLKELITLEKLTNSLDAASRELRSAHAELLSAAAEHEEIHAELGKFENCPACGAPL